MYSWVLVTDEAFAQNSSNIFDWLVKMTAKFREWSDQVGKSEGFKSLFSMYKRMAQSLWI